MTRTYLITGAANRIGRALALRAAGDGANVIIHYNSSQGPADELAAAINHSGKKAYIIQADLASQSDVAALIPRVIELAGPIDVLINSASIFESSKVTDFTIEDLHRDIMINSFAPLVLSRAFAKANTAKKSPRPVIINMLDTRITDYDREHAAYHLSKRMLYTLTRMTAFEFAPGIRVNAVAPGLILPPKDHDQAYLEQLRTTNPLHEIGDVDQVAAAVQFLVNTEFVTGQVIFIDGGRHLKGNVYDGL